MLKENVSLFSSKISLRSLHMCETIIIIHSIRDNERERDTLCLASSFEREEGIILSRFLLRVKKEAIDDDGEKQREQCDRSVLCTLLSGVRERKRRVMMMRKSRFVQLLRIIFGKIWNIRVTLFFFFILSLALSRE